MKNDISPTQLKCMYVCSLVPRLSPPTLPPTEAERKHGLQVGSVTFFVFAGILPMSLLFKEYSLDDIMHFH